MNFTAVEVNATPNFEVNTTFFPAIMDCRPPKSNCINNWGIEVYSGLVCQDHFFGLLKVHLPVFHLTNHPYSGVPNEKDYLNKFLIDFYSKAFPLLLNDKKF